LFHAAKQEADEQVDCDKDHAHGKHNHEREQAQLYERTPTYES
jgi:hypothetical protein